MEMNTYGYSDDELHNLVSFIKKNSCPEITLIW